MTNKKNKIDSMKKIPASVYRLQFGPHLNFSQAAELVPYLYTLGVDAVYCSPFFKTPAGSLHGYNIIDSNRLNPELGTAEDYEHFCEALKQRQMGQILDLVPNHVGIYGGNELWNDVLENGQHSLYNDFFDIEWYPRKAELAGKVLLPVLGDRYGSVLDRGELILHYHEGHFSVRYWEHSFPLSPTTYPEILERRLEDLKSLLGADHPDFLEMLSILSAFRSLTDHIFTLCENFELRHAAKEDAKKRLHDLCTRNENILSYVSARQDDYNRDKTYDLLDRLLNEQFFRLAFWRVAAEEINYRRFFDVNELAAIKIENNKVLDFHHKKVFELLKAGKIQGLRIDHPDGLYDPTQYFLNLQKKFLQDASATVQESDELQNFSRQSLLKHVDGLKSKTLVYPLYIIIEKILDRRERLPEEWTVSGTVGYAFLNALNGLFIDSNAEKAFSLIYENYVNTTFNIDELCYQKKKLFALIHMASEVNTLGNQLAYLSERDRHTRDFTKYNLTVALREVIACYPVYRTYMTPDCSEPSAEDKKFIQIAVAKAKRYTPSMAPSTYDFIEEVLLLNFEKKLHGKDQETCREFVLRFQQITGPVMAKGVEDTVFYLYNRLLSLNEVGGDLSHFGYSVTEFHRQNHERAGRWPFNFLTSDTHDTKRSEDVRLRLDVLSEMPALWEEYLLKWTCVNEKYRTLIDQEFAPTKNTQYFIYQSLLSGWPLEDTDLKVFKQRFHDYIVKALRESKADTNWINPNEAYEKAVYDFINGLFEHEEFLTSFRLLQKQLSAYGQRNALSAWVIKIGTPGVVDVYQGNELWNYNFVDPDNRRAVDFDTRKQLLREIEETFTVEAENPAAVTQLFSAKEDKRLKLYFYWRGLNFRREQCDIFLKGDYYPLDVMGERQKHAVAFMRKHGKRTIIFVVGRFFAQLEQCPEPDRQESLWANTYLMVPEEEAAHKVWNEVFKQKEYPMRPLTDGGKGFYLADIFEGAEAAMLCNFESGDQKNEN